MLVRGDADGGDGQEGEQRAEVHPLVGGKRRERDSSMTREAHHRGDQLPMFSSPGMLVYLRVSGLGR